MSRITQFSELGRKVVAVGRNYADHAKEGYIIVVLVFASSKNAKDVRPSLMADICSSYCRNNCLSYLHGEHIETGSHVERYIIMKSAEKFQGLTWCWE